MAPPAPSPPPPPVTPPPPSQPAQRPQAAPTATTSRSFYQRPLPAHTCTAFDSAAGKALFKSALLSGGLEAFFPLSQQFLTQNEPAYCGLGTLCMILNALQVDPAQTWRSPWRWFTQEMLDCCRPLAWVREHGITLSEFSCLARCNGLDATTRFAHDCSLDDFRADVVRCTRSPDLLMAVSYSRATLGQTGAGHFSPVGAYADDNGGMVLILDVARFKYPSYWVPVRTLYEALIPHDPATGQPRGYSLLRRQPKRETTAASSSLLKLNATIQTWPAIITPLLDLAVQTSRSPTPTYEALVGALAAVLEKPTGLPAVISRLEKQPLPTPTPTPAPAPEFDLSSAASARSEYQRSVQSLEAHVRAHCEMYRLLRATDELWRVEISVFLLAIFSMEKFVRRLGAGRLAADVRARVQRELDDPRVRAEAEEVQRQMESLDEACAECGAAKCCGGGNGACASEK